MRKAIRSLKNTVELEFLPYKTWSFHVSHSQKQWSAFFIFLPLIWARMLLVCHIQCGECWTLLNLWKLLYFSKKSNDGFYIQYTQLHIPFLFKVTWLIIYFIANMILLGFHSIGHIQRYTWCRFLDNSYRRYMYSIMLDVSFFSPLVHFCLQFQ